MGKGRLGESAAGEKAEEWESACPQGCTDTSTGMYSDVRRDVWPGAQRCLALCAETYSDVQRHTETCITLLSTVAQLQTVGFYVA